MGEKSGKVFILLVLVSVSFGVYAFKLFSMQVIEGAVYRRQSVTISSRSAEIPAQRGEIYDRNFSTPLVVNMDSFAVDIVPGEITAGKYDTVTGKLAQYLGIEKRSIDSKIPHSMRNSFSTIEIKSNVSFQTVQNIAENIVDLPGVSWRSKPIRNYVDKGSLSHVIGYVGDITKEELKILYNQGYKTTSIIGKTGIEKQYDTLLQGTTGAESRTVDVRGRLISLAPVIKMPEPGKNLVLTIDTRIQRLAEEALGNRVGAAVVLRPSNGEILAMVSYPYYDANIFNGDNTGAAYTALAGESQKPLLNRAVNAVYPPASTFKVVMTTAFLSEQQALKDQKIECKGTITYGNRTFRCHIGPPGHGFLDLRGGLAQSCNIYFWTVGRDYLGVDKIAQYARDFGLGQSLEVDLPSSSEGFIPTALWKERRYHEKWLGGDTMSMSIGQGYTLVTPLHAADMMAMVVNRGKIYRPHFLKEVRDPISEEIIAETEPEVLFESPAPAQIWEQLQSDLRYTVTNGSAQYPLRNPMVKIAGKTGTAEVAQYVNQWHSWFVAYAPFDAPPEDTVVVCVLVEAQNVWEWWAPYAANIIFQGIFANQTYDEAIETLGFRYLAKPMGRRE
ncbi:MAG: penicillin-binding protein 2 [Spirochaetaceae bacterium]|nr:penicillin-binding protein 2 [Spirochaetaceae bacterium]